MSATILVVDDDAAIRETLRDILQDEGYGVIEARDGAEGLSAVAGHHPDLILLDLHMPRVDGWQMYRRLHECGATPPTVIMTAGRNAALEARALKAAGSLAKPFDLDEVLAAVEDVLAEGH